MTDLPYVVAGQLGVSEEHQRVVEAWWREHRGGSLPARWTASMYNQAVDWWNAGAVVTIASMTAAQILSSGTTREAEPELRKSLTRCGFLIEHSTHAIHGPGAYRVSKDGQSNIFGEAFFKNMIGAVDTVFEQFMTMALKPDFPHPFAMEET